MQKVEVNKIAAGKLEKELKFKEGDIFKEKEDAEKELLKVEPLINEAKEAVSSIPKDAISEVKSFNNPPEAVQVVLEAVCMFMGMGSLGWRDIKNFICQPGILREITQLDINNIQPKIFQNV